MRVCNLLASPFPFSTSVACLIDAVLCCCCACSKISSVSHYADENEVLLVPFSGILVTNKNFNADTGMLEISANVLEDSNMLEDCPLDLPTVPA